MYLKTFFKETCFCIAEKKPAIFADFIQPGQTLQTVYIPHHFPLTTFNHMFVLGDIPPEVRILSTLDWLSISLVRSCEIKITQLKIFGMALKEKQSRFNIFYLNIIALTRLVLQVVSCITYFFE